MPENNIKTVYRVPQEKSYIITEYGDFLDKIEKEVIY